MNLLIFDFEGRISPDDLKLLAALVPDMIVTDQRPYTITAEVGESDRLRLVEWARSNRPDWVVSEADHTLRPTVISPHRPLGSVDRSQDR